MSADRAERPSLLRELIATYLRDKGCTRSEVDGREFWSHPTLGGGRLFEQVVIWQMTEEGAYGAGADVSGWTVAHVPLPVSYAPVPHNDTESAT